MLAAATELFQHLRRFGFTELEAKCLHVLSELGSITGYEIAKRMGISRSNVYAALQKLVEKGFVLESKGEPTLYQTISIDEIADTIEAHFKASIRYVKEHMPKQDAKRTEYFTVDGDAKVLERIRAELGKVKTEALCDLWSEEAKLWSKALNQAVEQGARILVSAVGASDLPGIQVFPHVRDEAWQEGSGRKFSFVLDRNLAIIGTRGGSEPTKAVITEHPAMVELLIHSFFQDVVLHELQQDSGAKLEDRYGRNFKKIIQKYTTATNTELKRRKKR
ncbi:Sugar-specific transcriptional regulator TrmB [Paenibacillus sp. GP183]|nr:Sugar-specific transcriptional regulator TrmB [Paenibacillus sp. GP183]